MPGLYTSFLIMVLGGRGFSRDIQQLRKIRALAPDVKPVAAFSVFVRWLLVSTFCGARARDCSTLARLPTWSAALRNTTLTLPFPRSTAALGCLSTKNSSRLFLKRFDVSDSSRRGTGATKSEESWLPALTPSSVGWSPPGRSFKTQGRGFSAAADLRAHPLTMGRGALQPLTLAF
jgi:hypothetical protein